MSAAETSVQILAIINQHFICRHLFDDATYHHILKFSVKLLKLGGELLRGESTEMSVWFFRSSGIPPLRVWI